MDISTENLEKVNSDGGIFYVFSHEQSEMLLAGSSIDSEVPKYLDALSGKWSTIKKDDLIRLALQKNNYTRNRWVGLFVAYHDDAYRRVDLQMGRCRDCDWAGWIGTPLSYELYIFNPKEASRLFDDAKKMKPLCCPKCDGKLDKHAIWTESG